jgi:serine-type D-Ala-D-Ala carboxypeptidase (penicillin-binding protein 5/6)
MENGFFRVVIGRRTFVSVLAFAICSLIGHSIPAYALQIEMSPVRAVSAILIEPTTGEILYEQSADLPRAPASIAKLMLELVVLERVERGELRLDEPVQVSAWASKIGGSQVYLAEGEVFPLEDLLRAIVISSANDACVAVAEHVAGTADSFVDLMNIRAREIGLTSTHYVNVHGLDDEPGQGNVTSARDISTIARRLVAMPHVLGWSSTQEAPFRDGKFLLQNTNKLLGDFPGLDGLKTGYTRKAGFCLCATAERKGMRFISVVMGAESNKMRFQETAHLLGAGFSQLRQTVVLAAGSPIPGGVPVKGGRKSVVDAVAAGPLAAILPSGAKPPDPVLVPKKGLLAPVAKGDTVGVVELRLDEGFIVRTPVVASTGVKKATIFQVIGRLFGSGS